jgi:hypothetical protein
MKTELELHFAMQDAKNAYTKCKGVRKVAKAAWDISGHCIDKGIYKNLGVKLKDLAMKLAIARMSYKGAVADRQEREHEIAVELHCTY